jgi:hypothetical protein
MNAPSAAETPSGTATHGARRILLVSRIHPVNLLPLLVCRAWMTVAYWRVERVPRPWLRAFLQVDPADYFSLDEWQALVERAFHAFKGAIEPAHPHWSVRRTILGRVVDVTRLKLQLLAIDLEEAFLFRSTALRWLAAAGSPNARRTVAATTLELQSPALARELAAIDRSLLPARAFAYLDSAWAWVKALLQCIREMASLMRPVLGPAPHTAEFVCAGVTPSEIPTDDRSLDGFFLARRRLLPPDKCLYVLRGTPSAPQREKLESDGIRWIAERDYGSLPWAHRAGAAISLLKHCLSEVFHADATVLQLIVRAIPWLARVEAWKPRCYITTVSDCWPESAEVAAMNAAGVRTINWSYGANTFYASATNPRFEDLGLPRSIPESREIWVWNMEVVEWLGARILAARSDVKAIGPVMGGDSSWLKKSPSAARTAFGITAAEERVYAGIFDVPPVSRETRLRIGHGPSIYPVEMLDQFFVDVEELLRCLPQLALIVKPKRSLGDPRREYAPSMVRLLDRTGPMARNERIIVVPHDIDPYIPVALADICIGVPFTSPVFAGVASGRAGIFHDPLGHFRFCRARATLDPMLAHGRDDLKRRIELLVHRRWELPQAYFDPTDAMARRIAGDETNPDHQAHERDHELVRNRAEAYPGGTNP